MTEDVNESSQLIEKVTSASILSNVAKLRDVSVRKGIKSTNMEDQSPYFKFDSFGDYFTFSQMAWSKEYGVEASTFKFSINEITGESVLAVDPAFIDPNPIVGQLKRWNSSKDLVSIIGDIKETNPKFKELVGQYLQGAIKEVESFSPPPNKGGVPEEKVKGIRVRDYPKH